MSARRSRILAATLLLTASASAQAPPKELKGFDAWATKALSDWRVPGMAVAVVRNDSVIFAKGYGVRALGAPDPITSHSLFQVASTTKAMTAAVIGMLVDEKKLRWDDAVTQHLPGFQLFDPNVTRELTIRDLLTHRSGLARGDQLWYRTTLPRAEVIRRVRFLAPAWPVRSQYGYQNIMYLTAGELAGTVAKQSWDDLMQARLFGPLGMTETGTRFADAVRASDRAMPHADIDDTLRLLEWRDFDNVGGAGATNSTVLDMAKWARFQLDSGRVNGRRLLSAASYAESHTSQMFQRVDTAARRVNPFRHYATYGFGWTLMDYRGREVVQHGGNLDGFSSMVATMPEERLGVVILTNANGTPLRDVAMYELFDRLLNATPARDWSAVYLAERARGRVRTDSVRKARLAERVMGTTPALALEKFAGVYTDSLYGDYAVAFESGALVLRRGPNFTGRLSHWHYNTFEVKWADVAQGTSTATFSLGANGRVARLELDGLPPLRRRPDAPPPAR
ncbi:MAG: serine hydrolase [Gemmatimonadaceae bacterium]|nr:serine hydrolase [Gemmatimonadaceae bacterium]